METVVGEIPANMESVYYVWWPLATGATLALLSFIGVLMGIIAVFAKRILHKLDSVDEGLQEMRVDGATEKRRLKDHIENNAIHCSQGDCLFNRRVSDAQI